MLGVGLGLKQQPGCLMKVELLLQDCTRPPSALYYIKYIKLKLKLYTSQFRKMKALVEEKLNSNERLTKGFRDYRKRRNIKLELPLITLFSKALANKILH